MNDHRETCDRRIVVGVDGSIHSKTALRWAITQARLVGAPVEVVSAWQEPVLIGCSYGGPPLLYEGESIATITEKVLAETVADVTGQQDQPVEIRTASRRVTRLRPCWKRLPARRCWSSAAVVMARSPGSCSGRSASTVQHAPCPVVVVPQNPAPSRL